MLLGTLIITSLILGYCGLYIDLSIWEDAVLFTYLGWSFPFIILQYKSYVKVGNLIAEIKTLRDRRYLYNRTEVEEEAFVKLAAALLRNKYNEEFLNCLFCVYNFVDEKNEKYNLVCELMTLMSKEAFDSITMEKKEEYAMQLLLYETADY